jgi:hypothetical protein
VAKATRKTTTKPQRKSAPAKGLPATPPIEKLIVRYWKEIEFHNADLDRQSTAKGKQRAGVAAENDVRAAERAVDRSYDKADRTLREIFGIHCATIGEMIDVLQFARTVWTKDRYRLETEDYEELCEALEGSLKAFRDKGTPAVAPLTPAEFVKAD